MEETRIEVEKVLHMNGGVGETSYTKNSSIQQKAFSLAKDMRDEAIRNLYRRIHPKKLVVADLGCSSGPNTFCVISEVIKSIEKICRELNHDSPEYQFFMNDLPENDFNNIFKYIGSFEEKLNNEIEGGIGSYFLAGVPGSFYGRIFPTKTLHFVHSCYSLMWLSQVPAGLENKKGVLYVASSSPLNVYKAYYEQFQRDLSHFLKCRAEELVEGGSMILTILGRKEDTQYNKGGDFVGGLLATALNDMVSEEIIKEEQLDTFNIPFFTPSAPEVKIEVTKEGSFTIDRLETTKIDWNAHFTCDDIVDSKSTMSSESLINGTYNAKSAIRAAAEPLLVNRFGEVITKEVFRRYQEILADQMSKEKIEIINVNITLTKKI